MDPCTFHPRPRLHGAKSLTSIRCFLPLASLRGVRQGTQRISSSVCGLSLLLTASPDLASVVQLTLSLPCEPTLRSALRRVDVYPYRPWPLPTLDSDATSSTAGINAASTFDRDLIRARGLAMGQEFRGKGGQSFSSRTPAYRQSGQGPTLMLSPSPFAVNIALGPMTNMVRLPEAGRNWEGFGEE